MNTAWHEILPKIETSHILIVHDIDIILNLDLDKLAIYFKMIKNHNIDRFSLSLFYGSEVINTEILDAKYDNANFIPIIHNFIIHFEDKHKSIRMIADDLHRGRVSSFLKTWFTKNLNHFIGFE